MEELHTQIISRSKAKDMGLRYYFTGNPCKRNGIGYRIVTSGSCACPECCSKRRSLQKKHYSDNQERMRQDMRERYYSKRQERADYSKRYHENNRERIFRRMKNYRENNPEVFRAIAMRRRASKCNRSIGIDRELSQLIEREAQQQASDMQDMFGLDFHVDHMIPLAADNASGLHVWYNLQVIPAVLNFRKGNRMMYTETLDWLKDFT